MARLTYARAGVNIDAADRFIRMIKPLVRSTERPEVLGTIGGFSGLFRPRIAGMKRPVLVSSTDGVGTKLMIADDARQVRHGGDRPCGHVRRRCRRSRRGTPVLPGLYRRRQGQAPMLVEIIKGIVQGLPARPAAPSSAGRRPSSRASTRRTSGTWQGSRRDRRRAEDHRRHGPAGPGTRSSGWPRRGLHSNGYSLWPARSSRRREIRGGLGKELLRPTRIYYTASSRSSRPSHQVHGPHHGRRLLRQHPTGHPRGVGGPDRAGRLAHPGHLPQDPAGGGSTSGRCSGPSTWGSAWPWWSRRDTRTKPFPCLPGLARKPGLSATSYGETAKSPSSDMT